MNIELIPLLLLVLILFFLWFVFKSPAKSQGVIRIEKAQAKYEAKAKDLMLLETKNKYIQSVIKHLEKIQDKDGSIFMDVHNMDRVDAVEHIISETALEIESADMNEEFAVLIAHDSKLIVKAYSDQVEKIEQELDSHVQDYFYDSMDERYGHLDDFDERVDSKMMTWNKKKIVGKLSSFYKQTKYESEEIETILAESGKEVNIDDFQKFIPELRVTEL